MSNESGGKVGVYLFIACYSNEFDKLGAFIAVTKAMLFDEIAIEMENLGDHAVLFTSELPIATVKEKLKSTKVNYLLIDLGVSFDLESLYGFLPESNIDFVKNLNTGVFSPEKNHLKRKMDESIKEENYEFAASLRNSLKII